MDERLVKMGVVPTTVDRSVGSFSILLVPASSSTQPQELVLKPPVSLDGDNTKEPTKQDIFPDLLGPYFELQDGESVDMDLVRKQAEADYQCTEYVCPHVSPAVLRMAAEAGTLQKIRIAISDHSNNDVKLQGKEEAYINNSDIVFMYYDESASFKGREENYRANSYIQQNAMNSDHDSNERDVIFGDVFLVRMQNNQPRSMKLVDLKDILCEERSK